MNSKSLNKANESTKKDLTEKIKAKAYRLGFSNIGISEAGAVDRETSDYFNNWIATEKYADMNYLANYKDKRLDPRLLIDGVKSILSVALNYYPQQKLNNNQYQFAYYSYGKDYHEIMKVKLHQLAAEIGSENYRVFCDTAPILERYWAVKAGIGWIGRNRQLIIPHAGSYFLLGEILVDVEFEYDSEYKNRCGNCHQCIEACPTGALCGKEDFDSSKCLSYQTIENKGIIQEKYREKMGNTIYGCDRCQIACPWNKFATPTTIPELQPSHEFMTLTKQQIEQMSEDEFKHVFKGSAVKRAKYTGLKRNVGKR
jgi:epoxyqueuosine reductase